MKKLILPIFCALLTLTSCLQESTFTMNNYIDYATSYQGKLVTDSGSSLNVVENESGSEAWRTEGSRFYILCDVLNRQLDIRLKSLYAVKVMEPFPLAQMDHEYDDPLVIEDSVLSGGYVNLAVKYQYNPASNHVPQFYAYWDEEGSIARVYLYFDGNHESAAYMDSEQLKEKEEVISLSLRTFLESPQEYSSLAVTLYVLTDDNKAEKKTYTSYLTL